MVPSVAGSGEAEGEWVQQMRAEIHRLMAQPHPTHYTTHATSAAAPTSHSTAASSTGTGTGTGTGRGTPYHCAPSTGGTMPGMPGRPSAGTLAGTPSEGTMAAAMAGRPSTGAGRDVGVERSPPAAVQSVGASAVDLSEDELRLLRKYMPEDAALMRPIPTVQPTPQLQHRTACEEAEQAIPRTVAPTTTPQSHPPVARKGLSPRAVNASPPAAVVLGTCQRSCAPATLGRSTGDDATAAPASVGAPTASETGPAAPAETSQQLQQAKEHVARLQRDLAERDLALQRLSAAHDAGVRRQIAMQEQLNGNLPTQQQGDAAGTQWQALRDENERLREQTARDGEALRQLRDELGTSQRTVTALQTERQQRRDTVGVVAAERLAEKETEYEQNVRHLRQIVEAQEQQLLTLDTKAAQGQALQAEVEMLRKREQELTESVHVSHDTLQRQSTLLEQADTKLTELKEQLAEATAKNDQDSEEKEAQLLDKILSLRTENQALRERAVKAEGEVETAAHRSAQVDVKCSSLETELGRLRETVAGHESTATTLLHGHASLRHSRSVIANLTSLCSAVIAGESPDLQTLIGGGVSASGDDAASIRAARRQAQKSLEPAVLASELLQGLEVLLADSNALLEALQDDVASKMGTSCVQQ